MCDLNIYMQNMYCSDVYISSIPVGWYVPCIYLVLLQDFSAKCRIFTLIHRDTQEIFKVHPIQRLVRRTKTFPILERFLFLSTTRRFGGVGAPECCEKMSDHIFPQIKKCMWFWQEKIMDSIWFFFKNVFLAEDYGCNENRIFPQCVKTKLLTCTFLGDVEG